MSHDSIFQLISIVIATIGIVWRLHISDKSVAVRHAENQVEQKNLIKVAEETRDEQRESRKLITSAHIKISRIEGVLKIRNGNDHEASQY